MSGTDTEITSTDFNGKVGFLPMNGLLFGALFEYATVKTEVPDYPAFDQDDTVISYGGFLKTVMPIGSGMAIGADLEAKQISTEPDEGDKTTDTNISGEVAFYPMAQLGIGVTLEIQSGDDKESEGNTYGIIAIFFPITKAGITASFNRFIPKDDDEGAEADNIQLAVMVRI